jgi:hypothetical protein
MAYIRSMDNAPLEGNPMFRKTDDHKRTASISKDGLTVTFMFDDGWENLLDCRVTVASAAEGRALLVGRGYEEYDHNAALKAAGFVWNGYNYALPKQTKEQREYYDDSRTDSADNV